MKKLIKKGLPALLLIPVLLYPRAAAAGASEGLALCAGVLIPSLFAFLVLSEWAISSGALEPVGRQLGTPMRILFNMPSSAFAPLAIGWLCGYPAGARAVSAAYASGALTKKQSERLLCFCICPSPQFAVAAVGGALLGSVRAGVCIFCASLLSCLTVGTVAGAVSRLTGQVTAKRTAAKAASGGGFVVAVANGTESMLKICGFTVLFSSLLTVAERTGLMKAAAFALSARNTAVGDGVWKAVFSMLAEITGGCSDAAVLGGRTALLLCAGGIGLGGVCVLCQCAALVRTGIPAQRQLNLVGFMLSRPLHALLTAGFTLLLTGMGRETAAVFSAGAQGLKLMPVLTNAPAAAVMLALSSVVLLCAAERAAR